MGAVAIVSGGMDSVTLAHYMRKDLNIFEIHAVGFNYGQRHQKELAYGSLLVDDGIVTSYTTVDLRVLQDLLGKSVLTDHSRDVPDGHYAEETMKATVVPNRNMIMLSIAAGFAVTLDCKQGVWLGVHSGDHFIYPDCRPAFVQLADATIKTANFGFIEWANGEAVHAPFLGMGKHDICRVGFELDVDYRKTWSCYKGDSIHCGRCGTCVERKEAFKLAAVSDPTEYTDPSFEIQAYRG